MAICVEWTAFIFAVLIASMTNNITLCTAACTATECIALASTNDDLGPNLGTIDSCTQELQNLTATIAQFLQKQIDIHITHDDHNCSCSSSKTDESTILPFSLYRDCTEILSKGYLTSGIYKIHPFVQGLYHSNTTAPVNVYCDMDTDGGGWTVFQRRHNGLVDFYRDWEDYKQGFGYVNGDYWLGLQNLHWLTSTARYELRVDLEDFDGNRAYAKYNSFQIGDERLFYKLILGDYEGTAGNSLIRHNYKSFSTRDQDQDTLDEVHCAQVHKGAWWYADCMESNLNGLYMGPSVIDPNGMTWLSWDNTWKVLKKSEMKIRRIG